jgi:hypothetical protein
VEEGSKQGAAPEAATTRGHRPLCLPV